MEDPVKRKVIKVSGYSAASRSKSPSRPVVSRPGSPLKGQITAQSSLSPPPTSFRPKAKVNSSAAISRKPSSSSSVASTSRVTSSPTVPPRSTSPFKSTPTRSNGGLTPASAMKARVTVRTPSKSNTTVSTPSSPESRKRAFTTVASDASPSKQEKRRSGSLSLHHKFSSSSVGSTSYTTPLSSVTSSPTQSPVHSQNNFPFQNGLRPIKVKSKISGLARSNTADTSLVSPTPSLLSSRFTPSHSRAPSISASHSQTSKPPSPPPPDQQFYPTTTAVPATNPYRFATTRHSPPNNQHHHYQPFLPNDGHFIKYDKPISGPNADPEAILLPPRSPPTSAVSFSSHSSLSYTSAGSPRTFSTFGSHPNQELRGHVRGLSVRSTSNDSANGVMPRVDVSASQDSQEMDGETDGDSDGSEHKVKAEAKSNRKIADLEITNRSLLVINSSLETTKHRQAKEIHELRRKLRESRLILPPRAFQAVKSKLDHDDTASEDDEDEVDDDEPPEGPEDQVYKRVKIIIDGLIETGKRALESRPEDFLEGGKGGTKVLHAEEVRMWRDSGGGLSAHEDHWDGHDRSSHLDLDNSMSSSRPISPSHVAMPDSDMSSEGEVEAMTSIILESTPPGLPPPITVTPSP